MALDTEEKLVWLGVKTNAAKQSAAQGDIQHLKEIIGGWDTFQTEVGNDGSYTEFETTLTDAGWTTEEAQALIDKIQQAYTDEDSSGTSWDEFEDDVVNDKTTYEDWSTVFGSSTGLQGDVQTTSGEPAAGIRIHESQGVSYSGVTLPPGTTEVFGNRIEFSQQDPPRGAQDPMTYSNFTTDDADNVVDVFQSIEFSADVANPNLWAATVTVPLTEDGSVIQSQDVRIPANSTVNVSFTVIKEEYICADYAIGNTDTILACWQPENIQQEA